LKNSWGTVRIPWGAYEKKRTPLMSGDVKRTPAKEKGTTWQAMDKLKFQTTHFDPFCGLNANFWGSISTRWAPTSYKWDYNLSK